MKFNPSWPQVALIAVLLSAIIVTGLFAPGVISVITSIVSTIVGALFVDLRKEEKPDNPPAPVLALVPKEDGKDGSA